MKIQITKNENERLRWLQKATNTKRVVLQCAHVSGDVMATADGFRFHAVKAPTRLLDKAAVKLPKRILVKDTEIEIETPDHKPPGFSTLIPSADPVHEVRIEAKYLRDVLSGLEGTVTLRFHKTHDPIEILGRAPDQTEAYALLMPRRANPLTDSTWRPYEGS